MISFMLNGREVTADVDGDMPLLWYVRDIAKMTGSKFGCGAGLCGACTMHIDGEAVRTCVLPISSVDGATVTTIEGLAPADTPHPVQQAWLDQQVPQCGYCQSGMIMAVTALLNRNNNPSDDDINAEITNVCRCGTYVRIRKAIHQAAKMMRDQGASADAAVREVFHA